MKELVIARVVDDGNFFEVAEHFARNILVGFARMAGETVGVVANQPAHLAGCLDIDSSTKGARFVRFCDAFQIPILTFEDVPGFLPGTSQQFLCTIRHGAKLLYAYAEATVPKITVNHSQGLWRRLLRNGLETPADGHQFCVSDGGNRVMGPEGAVNILYRRELEAADSSEELRQAKIDEYRDHFANPFVAAERGYVDDVIEPHETRRKVIRHPRFAAALGPPQIIVRRIYSQPVQPRLMTERLGGISQNRTALRN